MTVEHILDVLRVILRGIMVEFLLMRQLDWPCPVEELRCTIGTHVLKLEPINSVASGSAASTSLSDAGLLLSTVSKNLTIEESEVVRACSWREALIRIGVRTELMYNCRRRHRRLLQDLDLRGGLSDEAWKSRCCTPRCLVCGGVQQFFD